MMGEQRMMQQVLVSWFCVLSDPLKNIISYHLSLPLDQVICAAILLLIETSMLAADDDTSDERGGW